MTSEIDFLNSTGFAEIGAENEEFYWGNKKEDGISDFGTIDGEECDWPEMSIYRELYFNALLDREYLLTHLVKVHRQLASLYTSFFISIACIRCSDKRYLDTHLHLVSTVSIAL